MKITDALVAEHTIYLAVFAEIERVLPSLTTPAEVHTMARMVERLLEPHAAHESNLAYVALDHMLAQQGQLDRMHHDHREIDDRLRKIQGTGHCAEARRLLKAALDASREHFLLEERSLFPVLEKTLNPETLHELGRAWLERKNETAAAAA